MGYKGSWQRPGAGYAEGFDRIFSKRSTTNEEIKGDAGESGKLPEKPSERDEKARSD